jgi:hypothetical protein
MKQFALASLGLLFVAQSLSANTLSSDTGLYWVVGNTKTNRCEIVTANPVIDGDIYFSDGPYNSEADAKLARSTISACPPEPKATSKS